MVVCVIATQKKTGYIVTCTSCDDTEAWRYAKYYRSVGYNARVLTYEELEKYQEWEKKERMVQYEE